MPDTLKVLFLALVVIAVNCAVLHFVIRSAVLSALREYRKPTPTESSTYDARVQARPSPGDPYNWG